MVTSLLSWALGVAFGRFDVRLATGERSAPTEPEPFDPLPVCSPGMLTGDDGLPLSQPPAGYPLAFPADGLLVEQPRSLAGRHFIQTQVRTDVYLRVRELMEARNLSASGAVHPLLRERFGLPPLPPFDQQQTSNDSSHG